MRRNILQADNAADETEKESDANKRGGLAVGVNAECRRPRRADSRPYGVSRAQGNAIQRAIEKVKARDPECEEKSVGPIRLKPSV